MNNKATKVIVAASVAFIVARIWSLWHAGLYTSLLSDDYVQVGRAAWPECLLPHKWFYHYQPIMETIYVAIKSIFGWEPIAYRVVGMALYISCIPLLAAFAYRMTRDWLVVFATCALFITYPFSHEIAFWTIVQYGYCVELAGLLIGSLIVLNASAKGFTVLSGIALVATYIIGLGAHEQMFASLPVWALMCWFGVQERGKSCGPVLPKGALPVASALIASTALFILAKVLFTKSMLIVDAGPLLKLGNYSRMHFLAFRIDSLSFGDISIGLGLLASIALSVWALWSLSTRHRLWGILILSMQLSFVPSAAFAGLAPRYLYLPSVFSSILLGMLLVRFKDRLGAGLSGRLGASDSSEVIGSLLFCAVVLVISLSGLQFLETQADYWRSASRLSGSMVSDITELIDRFGSGRENVVIANPPDRIDEAWCDGAYVFRNGMQYAVGHALDQRGIGKSIQIKGRSMIEPLVTDAQEMRLAANLRTLVIDCSNKDFGACRVVRPQPATERGKATR